MAKGKEAITQDDVEETEPGTPIEMAEPSVQEGILGPVNVRFAEYERRVAYLENAVQLMLYEFEAMGRRIKVPDVKNR